MRSAHLLALLLVAGALAAPGAAAALRIVGIDAPTHELQAQTEEVEVTLRLEADCSSLALRRFPLTATTEPQVTVEPRASPDFLFSGTFTVPFPDEGCAGAAGTASLDFAFRLVVAAAAPGLEDLPVEVDVRLVGDAPDGGAAAQDGFTVRTKALLRSEVRVDQRVRSCVCERVTYNVTVANQGNMAQDYQIRLAPGSADLNASLPAPFTLGRLVAGAPDSITLPITVDVVPGGAQASFEVVATASGRGDVPADPLPFTVLAKPDNNRYGKGSPEATPGPGPLMALAVAAAALAWRRTR